MVERPPFARAGVLTAAGVLGLVLLVLSGSYGPHRDELYFASAGHRLAWGYPDQPSLVALLARLSQEVAPHNLVVLRLPSLVATIATILLTVGIARLLGGGSRAQVLTAVVTGTGALTMFLGHRLTTQTFDMTAWVAILFLAGLALADDRPRLWVAAGVVAGVGLNAKHDVVVCLLGLFVGILLTPAARHHLRSIWWWVGGLVALVLWLPNLSWQAGHGWPVFELSADISEEYGGLGGALEFVLLTLAVFSPLMSLVWLWGLHGLLRRLVLSLDRGGPARDDRVARAHQHRPRRARGPARHRGGVHPELRRGRRPGVVRRRGSRVQRSQRLGGLGTSAGGRRTRRRPGLRQRRAER